MSRSLRRREDKRRLRRQARQRFLNPRPLLLNSRSGTAMKIQEAGRLIDAIAQTRLERRRFLTRAGLTGLGAAATLTLGSRSAVAQSQAERAQETAQAMDTVKEKPEHNERVAIS